jgi:hypothetical protein
MRLVAFCEARSDFQLTATLVDRVLRDHATWISDVLDTAPEGIRTWLGDGEGRSFFDIHKVAEYALKLTTRVPQGHFDGQRGAAGALMARTAFHIVRTLSNQPSWDAIDGVVIIWDMDGQADERKLGLDQARAEAQRLMPFQVVLGRPDRMREAWVLAGFDPQSEDESIRFDNERQQLGFRPNAEAHRLTAADDHATRSAKRVLAVLTAGNRAREEQCWTDAALSTLRERGVASGLAEFLDAIEQELAPLCTGHSPPR